MTREVVRLYVVEDPYNKDEKRYIISDTGHYELNPKTLERLDLDDGRGYMRLFTHEGGSSWKSEIVPPVNLYTNITVGQQLGVAPEKTIEAYVTNSQEIYQKLGELSKRPSGKYGAPVPLSWSGIKN
ncbi:MAG: hypothetical protein AABY14_02145, partial [Nanoarchaeota archaeon]